MNLTRRWFRFQFVGLIGVGVQLSALALLVRVLGVNERLAIVAAVELAVLHNFVWHERWTWRDRELSDAGIGGRLLRFHLSNGLLSIAGNVLLMEWFRGWMGLPLLVANAASIATISLLNFAAGNWFVFGSLRPDSNVH